MPPNPAKLLYDMLRAGELLLSFTAGRTVDQYRADVLLRSAVERQFPILGEALNQLLTFDPDIARRISEHRNIINFRHILVHRYDRVAGDTVWGVTEVSLPVLLDEVRMLIDETLPPDGFVLAATHMPGAYEDFVRLVVPELQRRGLFQREYAGPTLRDNLGLARSPRRGWQR